MRSPAFVAILSSALLLGACAEPREPVSEHVPMTARAAPYDQYVAPTGSIFRTAGNVDLFSDPKPRAVGDILTVQIAENLNAAQSANSATDKKTSFASQVPGVSVAGIGFHGWNASGAGDNSFAGTGQTTSTDNFTGTITVTVTEVLPNGNLVVAGEKQIGIRRNSEKLKLTGVVNPEFIQPGNIIDSTQLADVRLDYRGGGNIEQSQIQGWFGRFFNSWSPF